MKKFRLLLMMSLAAVVSLTACDEPDGPKVATPTVAVTLDAASVTATSFYVQVATADAEKASWVVVAQGTEGVTAASVFETGTAIPAETLNAEELPALVVVEALTPETAYDFYVAVENKGKQALSEVLSVTTGKAAPAFSKVIEFYPTACTTMSLVQAGVGVGEYLTLVDDNYNKMMLLIQDGTTAAMDYQYLQGMTYPAVTATFGDSASAGSAVICDPSYTNATFVDAATETQTSYYIVGDKGVDADGVPYGVDILTVMPDQDNNMITLNLVAADAEGNEVLIVGQYTGPFGYPVAAAPIEFNLNDWRFTSFEATQDGNKVTLLSNNTTGSFKIIIDTTNYQGQVASEDGNLYVVGDNLEGYFFDPLDMMDYNFSEGGFMLYPGEKDGEYKLEVGARRGWKMAGGTKQFNITPDTYTITVSGLVEKKGSEFEDLTNGTADSEF